MLLEWGNVGDVIHWVRPSVSKTFTYFKSVADAVLSICWMDQSSEGMLKSSINSASFSTQQSVKGIIRHFELKEIYFFYYLIDAGEFSYSNDMH